MIFQHKDLLAVAADQPINPVAEQQAGKRMVLNRLTLILLILNLKLIDPESPGFTGFNLLIGKTSQDPFGRDSFHAFPDRLPRFDVDSTDSSQIAIDHFASHHQRHRRQHGCLLLIRQILK